MSDLVIWALAIEVIGLAFLPITFWLLRALPDRGYIFSKALGLVLMAYVPFLIASFVPLGGTFVLPAAAIALAAIPGWWFMGRDTLAALKRVVRAAAVEEALFLSGLVLWTILKLRFFGTSISHTEQFMDMMLLNTASISHSYPPADLWMSGHTVNYYYFGYLMFGTLLNVTGVAPAVGYNLSLAFLFAFTIAGCYSLGYALTRSRLWAALAPVMVAMVGNWHALLWQLPHAGCPTSPRLDFWGTFWASTRVVGGHFGLGAWICIHGSPSPASTINEYPLFSFILGDLHPHAMALPVTLLVVAMALNILFSPRWCANRFDIRSLVRAVLTALPIGALFAINSWDFPSYLLLVAVCLAANSYLYAQRTWWHPAILWICGISVASVALFLPFYLRFKPLAHGLGVVHTKTDPYEFLQVFGLPLLAVVALIVAIWFLLQPVDESESAPHDGEDREQGPPPAGRSRLLVPGLGFAALVVALVALALGSAVLVLAIGMIAAAWLLMERVMSAEDPNTRDGAALILIAVAGLVLAITEAMYVRDSFDGGDLYRMNTVFKLYYQAWVFLGMAGAYGIFRTWQVLRTYFSWQRWVFAGLAILGIAAAATYTALISTADVDGLAKGKLSGMAWIAQAHASDARVIEWLHRHNAQGRVVLEGTGDEYSYSARISVFSGNPTVMGWAGHEDQWRGADPQIAMRRADVKAMYTSSDTAVIRRLLAKYQVRYVVVGDEERQLYGGSRHFSKLSRFLRMAFSTGNTIVYSTE